MSDRTRNLVSVLAIVLMTSVVVFLVATNPTEADRVEHLGSQIKCPVCQGESIANSPADMARDMMSLVEERVAEGATDSEIVDELLSSYSGAVLLDPPASGATLLLWLAPLIAVVVGVGVIVWWRRHPGVESGDGPPPETRTRSRSRVLAGGLILGGAFAGIVVVAGLFLQDRDAAATGGPAAPQDLSEVSNETMEAVVAANLDDPQVSGMRLALAERYFEAGDFGSALPHFLAVADSPDATSGEQAAALVRLGWIAWEGDAGTETALGFFDQALGIQPASGTAQFLKARVLWCGLGDTDTAAVLLSAVLADTQLEGDFRSVVESDLAAIRNGEECP